MLTAVTGTIGSGKSAVLSILKSLGREALSCDEINAELLTESDYIDLLGKDFPQTVKNGAVDKKILSDLIFGDESARKKLNKIAHPEIMKKLRERIGKIDGDVYVEIPLLAESGGERFFDRVWVIVADERAQLERIALRDNIAYEAAEKKLRSQIRKISYDIPTSVIKNDGDLRKLRRRVECLLNEG